MIVKGEYIFKSFDEAYKFATQYNTPYEREHNIKTVDDKIIYNKPTIKVISLTKSDNSSTVIIFFKNSLNKEVWKFWFPDNLGVGCVWVGKLGKKGASGMVGGHLGDAGFDPAVHGDGHAVQAHGQRSGIVKAE